MLFEANLGGDNDVTTNILTAVGTEVINLAEVRLPCNRKPSSNCYFSPFRFLSILATLLYPLTRLTFPPQASCQPLISLVGCTRPTGPVLTCGATSTSSIHGENATTTTDSICFTFRKRASKLKDLDIAKLYKNRAKENGLSRTEIHQLTYLLWGPGIYLVKWSWAVWAAPWSTQ